MRIVILAVGAVALGAWAADDAEPLRPVPFTRVALEGFWQPRIETNRASTLPYDFKKSEETGRIANFARAGGLEPGPFEGIPFNDSDVFKIVEGAAYSLAIRPDPALDRDLDRLIATFAAAQEADGYLYTARRLFPPEKMPGMSGKARWSNLGASHELYNVGHMYEAAVAHHTATGKTNLLAIARRNADLIASLWKPGGMGLPSGHEEIEIGLLRLFEATGERKYLDTAKYLLDLRGRPETHKLYGPAAQDHVPVAAQTEAVGHAVRAGYLYTAMAHYAALTGDGAFRAACDALWEDIVSRKIHLTGGLGARPKGEAFGDAYELPNATAYNETCAAISGALFTHRMLLLHADAKYADVIERILYNGYLSGVALTGDRFFYPNPLESDGHTRFNHGSSERQPWFGCSCCPVNVVRIMPSLQGWFYATAGDRLYVNLFDAGRADVEVAGARVRVTQTTRYPWDGRIAIAIDPEKTAKFALMVRIPGWALNRPVPGDLYRYAGPDAPAPT
ncbi:MAG: glycoside hydrolase family 127 protein, partial [Verrucomicrobia bacterium]|nr:glycoside hydrolase family 127 protein [Verrucomicrobiota bacterium]